MKRILLLLVLLSLAALAETVDYRYTIHPDLGERLFTLDGKSQDGNFLVDSIEVRVGHDRVQLIRGFKARLPDKKAGFFVEDVNFDGYADLRLMEYLPAGANVPYLFWVYDPDQRLYVEAPELSRVLSPEVMPEQKMLKSNQRVNAAEYSTEYFKVGKDQPVLVKREDKKYFAPGEYELTVYELKHGRLTQVHQARLKD